MYTNVHTVTRYKSFTQKFVQVFRGNESLIACEYMYMWIDFDAPVCDGFTTEK